MFSSDGDALLPPMLLVVVLVVVLVVLLWLTQEMYTAKHIEMKPVVNGRTRGGTSENDTRLYGRKLASSVFITGMNCSDS